MPTIKTTSKNITAKSSSRKVATAQDAADKKNAQRARHQSRKTGHSATSLSRISGVGPALITKLRQLGIESLVDLLFHLPLRYEDRTRVQPIASLHAGSSAVIEGEVSGVRLQYGRRRSLLCQLTDDSGIIDLRFFHFSKAQQRSLEQGQRLRCFGEVSPGARGLCMIHPEYTFAKDTVSETSVASQYLTAIYPSTEGLQQGRWRNFIAQAFRLLPRDALQELLSPELLQEVAASSNLSLFDALHALHFPPLSSDIKSLQEGTHPAQRRLAFEELLAQRLLHLQIKQQQQRQAAPPLPAIASHLQTLQASAGFTLTNAQQRVCAEIASDLERSSAMLRLLQGDVGSGKTVVAAFSAIQAMAAGAQVALMAPTEILAGQHAQSLARWLEPLGFRSALLVSKMPAVEKRDVLSATADGSVQMLIGTHALIQNDVAFNNLALVIVDEQHRFGVDQRRMLTDKRGDGLSVHQLVMTATPIPRTLAMTFYADLDYSVIDELPPGRSPVQTVAIANDRREDVIARVYNACQQGRQAYWVCTLVEESEVLECQAAETTANELAALLPSLSIGLIHGRLKPAQKARVMQAFKAGDIQLLVATTVIEVGVDVANASLMIIENPERLGLAQLHQLRGRVGRGAVASHCVLLYQKPLSKRGRQRLEILRESNDGFVLAEQDLKMRGPGDVLGTRQSGAMLLRIADLERDADLVAAVVKVADKVDDTTAQALARRWCPRAEIYTRV
ncbi:MAG: ATP-dependent DNA helicase RecG [Pseudomonadales bacterium]|nr:MAG: ATP-dependent DNA helicase RecG [Pseudomonadales bacterium]